MNVYLQLGILLGVSLLFYVITQFIIVRIVSGIVRKTSRRIDDILLEKHVFHRSAHLVSAIVLSVGVSEITANDPHLLLICSRIVNVYFLFTAYAIFCAVLDSVSEIHAEKAKYRAHATKGIFQALKLLAFVFCIVLFISFITVKSPLLILSSLGAMTTVLILFFKDSILGFVAGTQINLLDLIRKGDWLEIPRHGADGEVIDISITSVKIRNWDNTITVIPAYDLISNSFKNWRGMSESGGRRIKRSLFIDQKSIRFLTKEEVESLSKIKILEPYLNQKIDELKKQYAPHEIPSEISTPEIVPNPQKLNHRHLTNIGTFRAYCNAYLKNNSKIHPDFLIMSRQLQPTPEGLPLEIYAFTKTTDWLEYENIQSDIFDHLIASLPAFGLSLFQLEFRPSHQ